MNNERRLIIASSIVLFFMLATYATQRLDGFDWVKETLGIGQQINGADLAEGSQQQAVAVCQRAVRASLGPRLRQMYVDTIATRYVASNQSYSVFINVVIEGMEREDTYAQCDVSAVTQELLLFRMNGPGMDWDLF